MKPHAWKHSVMTSRLDASSPGRRCALAAACFVLSAAQGFGQSGPAPLSNAYRGLWVGQATLKAVNEVSIPLDEDNIPRASPPLVATPTADQAHLRLIMHVNGAGQASLLKEVAIMDRTPDDGKEGSESDIVLITDESLYALMPPQVAVRLATATFDFGDSRTTWAVEAVVDAVVNTVTGLVGAASAGDFENEASQDALVATVAAAARTPGDDVIANADVTEAFDQYLQTYWNSTIVNEIATNPSSPAVSAASAAALALKAASFYQDQRAVDMIPDVLAAAGAESSPDAKKQAAHFWTAAHADVENKYHRFLAGHVFGDMITQAANAAAAAASPTATIGDISNAVETVAEVIAAEGEALTAKVGAYNDRRSELAVLQVLDAIVLTALSTTGSADFVESACVSVGRDTRDNEVARYPVSTQIPTTGYDAFVTSQDFLDSAGVAANAAARAAMEERRDNSLYNMSTLLGAAKVAAVKALRDVYSEAARTLDPDVPLDGVFGSTNGVMTGTVFLPANHPTNPFRHRRHPDHTTGFDITRELELRFTADSGKTLTPVGYGVDRINGIYREEIHGLHKPLGDDPDNPIGLIVVGDFSLERISLIDTLNSL